jgi:hypothetical protein
MVSQAFVDISLESDKVTAPLVVGGMARKIFRVFDHVRIIDSTDLSGETDGYAAWPLLDHDCG